MGTTIDYNNHCKVKYGTYVQTHEQHDNAMVPRTIGAIALRPTGNAQGGHYFFSLTTGKRINRNQWTVLPMPADVVQRVNRLCRRPLGLTALEFADRAGVLDDPVDVADDDNVEDDDYVDDDDDTDFDPDDDADNMIAGVDDDDIDDAEKAEGDNEAAIDDNLAILDNVNNLELDLQMEIDDNAAANENMAEVEADNMAGAEPEIPDDENKDNNINDSIEEDVAGMGDDDEAVDVNVRMDALYGPRTGKHDLRARKPRDYGHMHATTMPTLESIAMTQHSVRKGLKLFGDKGVIAVTNELVQLHERGVVEPKFIYELDGQQKRDALQYLMFLKQKRNGTIKGRGCADGRKQRKYTAKEEASSPTVAIESVMLSCVIDAKEKRDVGTVDLPGAFMQADMEDEVYMKLEGKMAELMVRIDPNYIANTCRLKRVGRSSMSS